MYTVLHRHCFLVNCKPMSYSSKVLLPLKLMCVDILSKTVHCILKTGGKSRSHLLYLNILYRDSILNQSVSGTFQIDLNTRLRFCLSLLRFLSGKKDLVKKRIFNLSMYTMYWLKQLDIIQSSLFLIWPTYLYVCIYCLAIV